MRPKIRDLMQWLDSLAEDRYPEDRLREGDADMEMQGILFCWMANAGARQTAVERGLNVIVTHESHCYGSPQVDPGCPPPSEWQCERADSAILPLRQSRLHSMSPHPRAH